MQLEVENGQSQEPGILMNRVPIEMRKEGMNIHEDYPDKCMNMCEESKCTGMFCSTHQSILIL